MTPRPYAAACLTSGLLSHMYWSIGLKKYSAYLNEAGLQCSMTSSKMHSPHCLSGHGLCGHYKRDTLLSFGYWSEDCKETNIHYWLSSHRDIPDTGNEKQTLQQSVLVNNNPQPTLQMFHHLKLPRMRKSDSSRYVDTFTLQQR